MKHLITFLLFSTFVFAQTPSVVQQDLNNYEPGELIVKLKDNVEAEISYSQNGKATSSFNVGALLGIENKVASSKVMFHQKAIEASIANSQKMKAVYAAKAAQNPNNGYTPKEPLTMKNIFVLKTSDEQENILQLIQQIQDNPNVEYAEPNYIYGIDDFEVGEIITAEQAAKMESSLLIDVDDPLYPSQSNITATNIDDVWDQYTTGDGSQVIAILDTGGDYTHPDLEANTWINEAELNGVEGFDDDGNGYVDDIRGWDFINQDNAPLDDNMHGTHVAGIAGAVGNNGIGIAGAAWDVKLMHIKVFQSTGQGNSTNIAAGVEYASSNGAGIINMSFGSLAESFTLELALQYAYNTSVLVAAAGNDRRGLDPCSTGYCKPMYPAAYNFVLGVQDLPPPMLGYSNYDLTGPIFTYYTAKLLNYELFAPGTNIMSTIPNGGYAALTGTSMSTPLVAGGLALYRELKPTDSKELIFGTLIRYDENNELIWWNFVDFLHTIEVEPSPRLYVISATARDTINNQNANGFWEPGETIEILPMVNNYWGPSDDVRVRIEFAEFEDTSKATIIQDEIQIGSMSAYSTIQNLEESLKIIISENIANNVDIKFNLKVSSGSNYENERDFEYVITSTSVNIISGTYENQTITLEENNHYLVSGINVWSNVHFIIEPGVLLEIDYNQDYSPVIFGNFSIDANGTSDNRITIRSYSAANQQTNTFPLAGNVNPNDFVFEEYILDPDNYESNISTYDYVNIENLISSESYTNTNLGRFLVRNCILKNSSFVGGWGYISKSNILLSTWRQFTETITGGIYSNSSNQYNNFPSFNNLNVYTGGDAINFGNTRSASNNEIRYNIIEDSDYLLDPYNISGVTASSYNQLFGFYNENSDPLYSSFLGPSSEEMFKEISPDASSGVGSGLWDWDNSFVKLEPYDDAHGIVWKVEVNDKNTFDDYAIMDPIGVGVHEFKVYFNRAMDTSVNPLIYYGVRIPFTQKNIQEEGTWSEDGKIYTVNHEINIGAADGINRLRISKAQDLDLFEIPEEYLRFSIFIQSAGSASTGFLAQGGLGKIDLEWMAPSTDELDDVLGYNMYRYQIDADGVESEPEKLNETLIIEDTDPSTTVLYFSDYDVLEGETYFYKYKILRTSFEETDYSNTVSSSPLTSTLGDSNGDFDVNVLDLVHDVDYILGNNPEPFIFVAGDVNADNTINVLDIVGTVDIIFNGAGGDTGSGSLDPNFYPSQAIGFADFTWEGNDLYVESMHNIGGIQLAFDADFDYILNDLPGIERLDYTQDQLKVLMLYSFNNTTIASTRTKLLTRVDATQDININLAVAGTTTGAKLTPRFKDSELGEIVSPFQSNELEFLKLFPNPTSGEVTLMYYLPEQMDGTVAKVYDMLGRLVWAQAIDKKQGMQQANLNLNTLQKGNYIVLISAHKNGGTKNIANKTLIIK